jgi:apolipoprotein D and lipocalin family protein
VKPLLTLAFCLAAIGCTSTPTAPGGGEPLQPVKRVDLARYAGTWHEIARTPFAIQDRCARDTTASYQPLDGGRISVVNRCVLPDGREFSAEGTAWVVDPATNARLEVSFLPAWLRWLPVGRGDYWILELAPDYSWVVIGEPGRRYAWILARTTALPDPVYRDLLQRLARHGYFADGRHAAGASAARIGTEGERRWRASRISAHSRSPCCCS